MTKSMQKTATPSLGLFFCALLVANTGFSGELYCGNQGYQDPADCVQPQAESAPFEKIYFTLKIMTGSAEGAEMLDQALALEKIGDIPMPGNRRVMFFGRFSEDAQAFQALEACVKLDPVRCAELAPEVVRIDIDGRDAEGDEDLRARSLSMVSAGATGTLASAEVSTAVPEADVEPDQPLGAQLAESDPEDLPELAETLEQSGLAEMPAVAAVEDPQLSSPTDPEAQQPADVRVQPAEEAPEAPAGTEQLVQSAEQSPADPAVADVSSNPVDAIGTEAQAQAPEQAQAPTPSAGAGELSEAAPETASADASVRVEEPGPPVSETPGATAGEVVDSSPEQRVAQNAETGYPTGLYRLPASTRAVLWVELEPQRLHVFERSGDRFDATLTVPVVNVRPDGSEAPGTDAKTPLGVYRLMTRKRDRQLADFYGSGAFTLNYPNPVDSLRSRRGSGLWLHGAARQAGQRAPVPNDMNLSISNDALNSLDALVTLQQTPIVIDRRIEWRDVDTLATQREGLEQAIEAWRSAWSALDNDAYLAFYGRDFQSPDKGLAEWKRYKTRIHRMKKYIDVQISKLSLLGYPGEDGAVLARFRQNYKSSNYNADGWKEQLWRRNADGDWKIVFEGG